MNDVVSWVALPGGSGVVLRGVPVGPEHVPLLHRWAAEPHLTPWWDLTGLVARLQAHLDGVRLAGGQPWVVVEGDAWLGETGGGRFVKRERSAYLK